MLYYYHHPYGLYFRPSHYPGGAYIGSGTLQPQPWPQPVPTSGGCLNKWTTLHLKDGRMIRIFITTIDSKSLGGSVFVQNEGWIYMALDLGEVVEATCQN